MARIEGQKAKLLLLLRNLARYTDEDHWITVPRILELLGAEGVNAERKSVYADIETLRELGCDIAQQKGRGGGYWLAGRTFQLPELKLLVDTVQASKFITQKKSEQLIKTLSNFASEYQARDLKRQVFASSRIKTMNESIYYNVDALHRAIAENRQVRFVYQDWTLEKKKAARRGGGAYTVSPWALLFEDENYYLVAYEENRGLRHYRVDKMASISLLEAGRLGGTEYDPNSMRDYAKPMFSMFGAPVQRVELACDAGMIGPMLDRFGVEATVVPQPGGGFTLYADVAVSPPFFGWVCGFGGKVRIAGPDPVRREFLAALERIRTAHGE